LSGDRFKTTSTTTYTLQAPGGTGTITVGLGLAYSVAQSIIIAYDANNHNEAEVTSYDPLTGSLSFIVFRLTGSGTYSVWSVNVDGASGGDGSSGSSGTSGTSATAGTSGTTGTSGSSGTSGTTGTSGSSGSSGTSAVNGTNGTSGTAGTTGTSGSSGTSGTTGTSGSSGTSGTSATNGTGGTSGTSGSSGTSGTTGTSGTSATSGTSGTSATSGTTGTSGTSGTNGTGGTSGTSGSSATSGTSGTSGSSGATQAFSNVLTMNNSGAGDASGTTYNGSAPRTISHNTIGALALTGGTMTGSLISSFNTTSEPLVNATFSGVGGANIGGILVNGTAQAHVRFLVGSNTWGGAGAKQWQIRVGAGASADDFRIYSWTYADDILYINGPSGNVGINSAPDASSKLKVTSTDVHPNVLRLENNNTTINEAGIRMRAINPAGTAFAHADIGVYATGSDTGNFFIKFPFSNSQQTNVRFALNSAGNLMLGTTTATTGFSRLSLVGGEPSGIGPNTGVQLTYNAGTFGGGAITTINAQGGGLAFYTFTGNVGSETYALRLTIGNLGAAIFTGSLQANSGITSTTVFGGSFNATDGTNQVRFGSYQNTIGSGNSFDGVIYTTNASSAFYVLTGGSTTPKLTITSTGAATFSSSVTSTGLIVNGTEFYYAPANYASGGFTRLLGRNASTGRIEGMSSGDLQAFIGIGNYLPLSGGTLTGTLTISGLGYGNALVITTSSVNGADIRLTNTGAGGKAYSITSTGSGNALAAGGLQFYNETDGVVAFGYTSSRNFLINTNSDNGSRLRVNGTGWFDLGITANGASAVNGTLTVSAGTTSEFAFGVNSNSTFAFGGLNGRRAAIIAHNSLGDSGLQFGWDTVDKTGVIAGSANVTGAGIDFYTFNGSAWGNRMRVNKDGDVGIGTNSPQGKLDITGNTSGDLLYLDAAVNTDFAYKVVTGADDALVLRRQHITQGDLGIMSWTYSGKVGIGTNTPSSLLTITGPNGAGDPFVQLRINGTGAYPNNIAGIALDNSGVQQHIRFLKNGVERFQMRYNNGATEDNRFKFYSFITGNDFVTFNANNDNVGFGTTNPLAGTNNSGVQIARGGHTTLLIGDGTSNGGVIQSSDDSRRVFIGANIYDDVSNSWQQFIDNSGYAAFDAIGGGTAGLARILVGSPANSGYGGGDIFFEGYRDNSTSYIRMRTNTGDALFISNAGRTILGSESDNGYKLQVVNGNTWSNGVRIGRDFSITNRATVRLDSNGDEPADILFGRTAAALETSWNGVFWSLSSRGSGEGNNFRIYRGPANTGGSEIIALNINPSAGAATFINTVTATAFFESSDKRLKSNIIDLDVNVSGIIAKTYLKNGAEEIGYLAQDVEGILPSAISKREDGYLDLSYRQVHTAKIAYLEKRIEELEQQLKKN
jgi:hypothetical protein